MTRDKAIALSPIIAALSAGEKIQVSIDGKWYECNDPQFDKRSPDAFRIKHKPREWWIEKTKQGGMYVIPREGGIACPDSEVIKVREVLD